MTKISTLIAFIVLFCAVSHGKQFSNSYVSFQLPPNWNCKVAGTEWVCKSSNNEQAKQAIIILTAKEVGPNDNFAYYNQYLKAPKNPKHRDGTVGTSSKVQHLKTVQINNHSWVDGLHLGSLLPNFYTRYLVTIKEKIAVLVTFSAKKEFYTLYSRHFFEAINSLRVTATAGSAKHKGIKGPNEELGNLNVDMDGETWEGEGAEELGDGEGGKGKSNNMLLYGAALLMIGGASIFLIKRRRK